MEANSRFASGGSKMRYKSIAICTIAFIGGCAVNTGDAAESQDEPLNTVESALTGSLPNAVTPFFIPPHVAGDKEFDGHGPVVFLKVSLSVRSGNQIWTTVTMDAVETKSDWTRAQGTASYLLYTSTSPMVNILGSTSFDHYYIDTNHEFDRFSFSSGNLVKSLLYVGDTYGKEAGTRTGVQVYFHPITFTQQ